MEVSRQWSVYIVIACLLLIGFYILWHKRKQNPA